MANALKEVEAVQVKVSAALSEVCAKLKESEIRLKQMGLSKTASQASKYIYLIVFTNLKKKVGSIVIVLSGRKRMNLRSTTNYKNREM